MLRLLGLFLAVAVIVSVPFLIWRAGFEQSFSREGAAAWLSGYGRWAGVAGVLLLMSDLVLPVPATAVMAGLGLVYGRSPAAWSRLWAAFSRVRSATCFVAGSGGR